MGLQFGDNFFMYDQGLAAYHTSTADAAALSANNYEAKQYYNIAKTYDPLNYHLHYKLGSRAKAEGKKEAAYSRSELAGHPDLSNWSLKTDKPFLESRTLDLRKCEPHAFSGELANIIVLW